MRVALHVRRGDVMPVDKGDRGAREGAAWGLPLKAQCKAVELAAYWPCLRAYLESRANETARVVVVSTAGRADLPGADDAPVPDVAYLADRPPPPCFPASCWFLCLRPSVAVAEHNTPSTQARDELGIELRSFYRTSPPAADRWVHRARYEVCFSASFFPCPVPGPLVLPRSPTRERPLYAIDATRHNKRRQNAATRRSRPSRRR